MNIDVISIILEYAGYDPIYRLICSDVNDWCDGVEQSLVERMDREYPYWDRTSIGVSLPLEVLYSIPIYHLNMAAMNDDWSLFILIISKHGYQICPAALLITHIYDRFDLSERIIDIYGHDMIIPIVDRTGDDYSTPMYTWMGGIYRYPILYMMHVQEWDMGSYYMQQWFKSTWNHTMIGFIHKSMDQCVHEFPFLKPFVGDTRVYPLQIAAGTQSIDTLCNVHYKRSFLEYTCVHPTMIEKGVEFLAPSDFGICVQSTNPYWIENNSRWINDDLKIIISMRIEAGRMTPASKLAYCRVTSKPYDDTILKASMPR